MASSRVAPLMTSPEPPLLTSKEQTQRLQERDPNPPFSLPEPEPKECPFPSSQPLSETEQDVFLIKDTWEAFPLRSFPGLSFILTYELAEGKSHAAHNSPESARPRGKGSSLEPFHATQMSSSIPKHFLSKEKPPHSCIPSFKQEFPHTCASRQM